MTSEVVVMNNLAVALATDSAATVSDGRDNKVYNSANKLFMLSKCYPVGVMVYDNSSLLGIPWETILKLFREQHLKTRSFDHLEDYGDELIHYLDGNLELFPEKAQRKFFLDMVEHLYGQILQDYTNETTKRIEEDDEVPRPAEEVKRLVLEALKQWDQKADAKCFKTYPHVVEIATQLSGEVHAFIVKYFGQYQIDAEATEALRKIAVLAIQKEDIPQPCRSGLVIAGFGEKDYVPTMQVFDLGEVYGNKLKYRVREVRKIDADNPSIVQAFAHDEMVNTFLRGISPTFQLQMLDEIIDLVVRLPGEVIDGISDLSANKKMVWKKKVLPMTAEPIRAFVQKLESSLVEDHKQPILKAIINLPIDELAHVAQSLVNLNSFEKRMSLDTETVGGPVDVAVISKGDGFIWIERKHYFRHELNHHFFRNYDRNMKAEEIAVPTRRENAEE